MLSKVPTSRRLGTSAPAPRASSLARVAPRALQGGKLPVDVSPGEATRVSQRCCRNLCLWRPGEPQTRHRVACRTRAVVGERIAKWLDTPFDLVAFPSRAGLGLLVSFPERVSSA